MKQEKEKNGNFRKIMKKTNPKFDEIHETRFYE